MRGQDDRLGGEQRRDAGIIAAVGHEQGDGIHVGQARNEAEGQQAAVQLEMGGGFHQEGDRGVDDAELDGDPEAQGIVQVGRGDVVVRRTVEQPDPQGESRARAGP